MIPKGVLLKSLLSVLAVFAPIKGMLISSLVLIAADLITGIIAAKKRGESINSSGFRRTVVKVFVYQASIMLAYLAQHFMMSDAIPVTNMIASFVGLTELTSVLENLNSISGGNLLKQILEKLNSVNNQAPKDKE